MDTKRLIKAAACVVIPLVVWSLPLAWLPIPGITVPEQRVVAIFVFAMLGWILEPVPVHATAITVLVLEVLTLSDKAPLPLQAPKGVEGWGTTLDYRDILSTLASPIIILFLGGFFLASAARKYRLDRNLARVLLRPFGTNPANVMLGLMTITAVLSMFMSNTATTVLMLALLAPALTVFESDDKGRIAFTLAIPFAANLGGIGTPIGSPPNAVAMKYLTGENAVSFAQWMAFGLPYVIVSVLLLWLMVRWLYPSRLKTMDIVITDRFARTPKAWVVYITFIVTIGLWLTGDLTGMNSYVIALIPIAVFSVTGVTSVEDLKLMSWDVLWLVSGGIALGVALEKTGLSVKLVNAIPFDAMPPCLIVLLAVLLATGTATVMSNTATANLLLPVIAALGASTGTLVDVGGAKGLIIATTLACSLGMALPISTPPNALAYATGMIQSRDLLRAGLLLNLICLGLLALLLYAMGLVGFFG